MSFASPFWLLAALAAAVAAAALWRLADRRRRADLERFAADKLLPDLTAGVSQQRRTAKRGLVVAGICLAGIALAGPQYGFTWEETQRRGIDVLIALDVSRSMLAQDVAPNRLERAKLAITDLVAKLGSDRVGLIAFAGTAFLQCPLTLDHAAFLHSLEVLEPGVIPAPGSDLASALDTASEALATEARNVKLLVLFSDGEDLGGGAIEAARRVAADGVRVFTVGVGSAGGELIPLPRADGGTEFLKDDSGQFVKSRLDADTLEQVAEITGGFYEPLGRRGEAVTAIYDRALAPLPKEELASRMRRVPIPRFQWPLALAILCLALEPLLRERRGGRSRDASAAPARGDVTAPGALAATRATPAGATSRGAALVALVLLGAPDARAVDSPQAAESLYAAGEYERAVEAYRAAAEAGDDPRLDFNLGAAAYKAGDFDDAAGAFARALRSADPEVQEQGFYNLGNARFRAGQGQRESNPQQTLQAWQQALDAYDAALELDPEDADARFNREFVAREIEKLQQQQQGQQDPQQGEGEKQPQAEPQAGEQAPGEEQQEGGQQQAKAGEEERQQDRAQQQAGRSPDERDAGERPEPRGQGDGGDASEGEEAGQDAHPERAGGGAPDGEDARSARRQEAPPGQMSAAEARQLLDSLEDGEASLSALEQAQRVAPPPEGTVRDW